MNLQALQKKKLPHTPGVYFFLGKKTSQEGVRGREVLYIGKAGSLSNRVRSYFSAGLPESRSPAILRMVEKAHDISIKKTDSVLEALIVEAYLIKKYQPKYNVKEKDDKSFNYIVITKEAFPQVVVMRHRDLLKQKDTGKIRSLFGPFPQGTTLKRALGIVRKIFPFRDKRCTPKVELTPKEKARPCFSYQIGLCPGVCLGEIEKKVYRERIRNIEMFFSGKKKTLIRKLEKEMKHSAREREYERAGEIKKTIFSLNHIQDVALLPSKFDGREYNTFRIEGYDVAHTGGKDTGGVMVVVVGGETDTSSYRKFSIREAKGGDDVGALAEILTRRMRHNEWPLPDLIVVDGGVAQKRVAEKIIASHDMSIPIVSVVKDEHHKPREIKGSAFYKKHYEKAILLANYEAHRFALAFHTKSRGRKFLSR
ncbi:MAG: hypothetical protein WD003_00850 [Candidatus Paceibacterota bacterium]